MRVTSGRRRGLGPAVAVVSDGAVRTRSVACAVVRILARVCRAKSAERRKRAVRTLPYPSRSSRASAALHCARQRVHAGARPTAAYREAQRVAIDSLREKGLASCLLDGVCRKAQMLAAHPQLPIGRVGRTRNAVAPAPARRSGAASSCSRRVPVRASRASAQARHRSAPHNRQVRLRRPDADNP